MTSKRDYSLRGENSREAIEAGLVSADWYHPDIPRKTLKELMKRSDGPAIRDTAVWFLLMIFFGGCAFYFWPSGWCVPFFLAYGVLYGSASDSRWHECSHRTAFKTRWMNDVVYQIASFMIVRNPTVWRWSHTRHHTDTYIVGHDPEIIVTRPPVLPQILLGFFGLGAVKGLSNMIRYSAGKLSDEEKTFVPKMERSKVFFVARVWLLIYLAVVASAIGLGSLLPLLFVGLPAFYGCWHVPLTGLLQHSGLADNVLDHRLNSRTVYMNPISRFIYWNMNFHIEHHMFPMVPYHKLPELHELIKADTPAPDKSMLAAYAAVWSVWMRQLKDDENIFLTRELPSTAMPYKDASDLLNVATIAQRN